MKRKWLMWFTLVEILIVIVIIGILIWALVPRMSAAQGRARDVARKNDLAQLQSAIVTSQQDKGRWPGMDLDDDKKPTEAIAIKEIRSLLETAGMNSVPSDPLGSNVVSWLWSSDKTIPDWEYGYMVAARNGTDEAWFVLMAKTEVEWWSNRVVCTGDDVTVMDGYGDWFINKGSDLWTLQLCTSLTKTTDKNCWNTGGTCYYSEDWQLRYVLLY